MQIKKYFLKLDYLIPFKEINIFRNFLYRIFHPKELLNIVILVIFNRINYYEASMH